MTPAKKMADVNKEYNQWRKKFFLMDEPLVHCIECGRYYWHDHVNIQRHYLEYHIGDNPLKREQGWKFRPTTGRNARVI